MIPFEMKKYHAVEERIKTIQYNEVYYKPIQNIMNFKSKGHNVRVAIFRLKVKGDSTI